MSSTPLRVFLTCLVTFLAGCNDSEPKPTSTTATASPAATGTTSPATPPPVYEAPKPPDVVVCSLVTQAEAAAILGELREEPKAVESGTPLQGCGYLAGDGSGVSLRVYASTHWAMRRMVDGDAKKNVVPGLGEEAYWVQRGGDVDLWARKGNAVLNVNGSVSAEKARAFAEKALGRL